MNTTLHSLARRVTRVMMKSDLLWEAARRISEDGYFFRQRYPVIHKRARRACAAYLDQLEVLDGPFVGMKYDRELSVGSSLWPKLLGTYESELRPCFQKIGGRQPYRNIIDIGFAEGYYLVGFGRLFQHAKLIGFDTEVEAQTQCKANARINGIDESRLQLFGAFEPHQFDQVLEPGSLVIVDCEGTEREVVGNLDQGQAACADWLIETHDHLVDGTTDRIVEVLGKTHDLVEVITDPDLHSKCRLLPTSIRESCDSYVQEALVSEGRQAKQSWIFATRRAA